MELLLLALGKPVAGLLAGAMFFTFTVRNAQVEAHEAEAARLRAEVEALKAEQRIDEEALLLERQQDKLLVPQEVEEAREQLVVPEEIDEARKNLIDPREDPEP